MSIVFNYIKNCSLHISNTTPPPPHMLELQKKILSHSLRKYLQQTPKPAAQVPDADPDRDVHSDVLIHVP